MRCHAAVVALLWASASVAQPGAWRSPQGPHTLNPGDWPAHYPHADETEAAIAAPEVHHVRYVDAHVRLVEVAYFPGVVGNMHGHPYPSVFAVDAPVPKSTNTMSDPAHNMVASVARPPQGMAWPLCRAAGPQNPHHETNQDSWPHHFYRLEFLRIDGADLGARWRDWHRYSHVGADGTRTMYEDDHIRLVEVMIRPGETRRIATPFPSVLAIDAADTPTPRSANGHDSAALPGFPKLRCSTTAQLPGQTIRNRGAAPVHFYRIEFKRIDGDGLKDRWREWYPWMATLKDAWDRSPNTPNF